MAQSNNSRQTIAVLYVPGIGGTKTVNQIAQEYGVHPVQIGQWKREIQAQAKILFEGIQHRMSSDVFHNNEGSYNQICRYIHLDLLIPLAFEQLHTGS